MDRCGEALDRAGDPRSIHAWKVSAGNAASPERDGGAFHRLGHRVPHSRPRGRHKRCGRKPRCLPQWMPQRLPHDCPHCPSAPSALGHTGPSGRCRCSAGESLPRSHRIRPLARFPDPVRMAGRPAASTRSGGSPSPARGSRSGLLWLALALGAIRPAVTAILPSTVWVTLELEQAASAPTVCRVVAVMFVGLLFPYII